MTQRPIVLGVALTVALVAGIAPAPADAPPASCGAPSGCNLGSDLLVFGDEGDPAYRVIAHVTDCGLCNFPPAISPDFELFGSAQITFGPYSPAINLCPANSDQVPFTVAHLNLSSRNSVELGTYYVPRDPIGVLALDPSPALRTACVSAANLDYAIPRVLLTGMDGAKTELKALSNHASLTLPESVRASDGSGLLGRIELDQLRFTQGLSLTHTQNEDQFSPLRFWPDGLPIRIGPDVITYTERDVSFTTGAPPTGPVAYGVTPPDPSNVAAVAMQCGSVDPEMGDPCTGTGSIWNAGYFDGSWMVSGTVAFDQAGVDLDLALAAGEKVVYEPLFPRGTWVRLNGPAGIQVRDSAIQGGAFNDGVGWLRMARGPCPDALEERRRFALNGGAQQPILRSGDGGSLLAGATDLNPPPDGGGPPQPILWTYNEANELGCGTLYVPPALTSATPSIAWNASAVPTVLDRGIYSGYNFNRNGVCLHPTLGVQQELCVNDNDCDAGQGETCVDGGFEPHCPGVLTAAKWTTQLDSDPPYPPLTYDVLGASGREMAFVLRRSGVTGVFDAGDNLGDTLGNPVNGQFQLDLDTFGLAFKASRSERADTITAGDLVVPWPSDTEIPLLDIGVCDCGRPQGGRTPNVLFEKSLAYWSAPFSPYGVTFSPDQAPPNCLLTAADACAAPGPVKSACIDAITPVARFEPDLDSSIGMAPDGQANPITPHSIARVKFDEDKTGPVLQKPYVYDLEMFNLSQWPGTPPGNTFGYYDAIGDLHLPFFGLTPSGIKVQREPLNVGLDYLADLHQECDEAANPDCATAVPSHVEATRKMAADSVVLPFRVDYLGAAATADPDDGFDPPGPEDDQDAALKSRGTLFAYTPEEAADPTQELNFGSVRVAAGLMMRPDDAPAAGPGSMTIVGGDPQSPAADVGAGAALRLWGAASAAGRTQLASGPGVFAGGLTAPEQAVYADAIVQMGLSGEWYNTASPLDLKTALHSTDAIDALASVSDAGGVFNLESTPPGLSPPVTASEITGALEFSPDLESLDLVQIASNLDTGGEFFKFDASTLTIDRHVKEGAQDQQPIAQVGKEDLPGASQIMQMPAQQDIPFPSVPGMAWDFDYTVDSSTTPPSFQFESLTGSVDLTQGGLSGVGFDKMGATLKFWKDGNWYFTAELKVNFDGNSASGGILLGNTQDKTPLQDLDWNIAEFLGGIDKFDGGYIKAGGSVNVWDTGCLLRITGGGEVGGWYLSNSFGGKVRYWLSGEAACVTSIRGDGTLMGGMVNDLFKISGNFWAAGGAGFCDPDDWDTPEDVLDDDFCASCVAGMTGSGHYPPKDLDITFKKDYLECSL